VKTLTSGSIIGLRRCSHALRGSNLPIEPIGYTGQEFERMKQAWNPFIIEVVDKGKELYQK